MGKTQTKVIQGEEIKEIQDTSQPKTATAAEGTGEVKIKKRKVGTVWLRIKAAWNNTFIAATDSQGNVLFRVSTGQLGFKGNRKSTPFAGSRVANAVVEKLKGFEFSNLQLRVSGIGPGRDSAIKTIFSKELPIETIVDVTPIPFGGPRPAKTRRV